MPEQHTIKKWRIISDMQQQEVADKLGVTAKTVGQWEKKDATPSNVVIYALAKLYKIEIDQIKV